MADSVFGRRMRGKRPMLGTGERFDTLRSKLSGKPGIYNPAGLAASIGRRKYGKTRFSKLASKGKPGY